MTCSMLLKQGAAEPVRLVLESSAAGIDDDKWYNQPCCGVIVTLQFPQIVCKDLREDCRKKRRRDGGWQRKLREWL